eukprot:CAMPEP_0174371306 /NCGR_PEP_ID=MMETSP0811_2-20130205/99316_1 /TAXON_ID=73025 ORGANISM="Eutreptiella gymnastica-like, Strain CCMP1594" /NCGR_SAMPLE_ID=MMETSP0811_2 /ASSEMBLY_ACC=CAM_ASM_000667 /LENGTH=123 /DNA_ID=CAMNT_0015517581 /DNA_START=406 /DNA_END=777 /DNA_ORIENTATION=-
MPRYNAPIREQEEGDGHHQTEALRGAGTELEQHMPPLAPSALGKLCPILALRDPTGRAAKLRLTSGRTGSDGATSPAGERDARAQTGPAGPQPSSSSALGSADGTATARKFVMLSADFAPFWT